MASRQFARGRCVEATAAQVGEHDRVGAIGLLVISGWLGGKMVYELGIAVDTGSDARPR
jgi:hypothetical protein